MSSGNYTAEDFLSGDVKPSELCSLPVPRRFRAPPRRGAHFRRFSAIFGDSQRTAAAAAVRIFGDSASGAHSAILSGRSAPGQEVS